MMRITTNKPKRLLLTLITILLVELILTSMSSPDTIHTNLTAIFLEESKDTEEELFLVSNHIEELMATMEEKIAREDELDALMDSYEVPYEYRDYTRQLCMIYNIDPFIFVALVHQESKWGRCKDMNLNASYRQYGDGYIDVGLTQLSSRYHDHFEDVYFNSELIFSLGYVRRSFDATDPFTNLQVGASYFSYLVKYCDGNYENALMSYNAGMGKVKRGLAPKSTIVYATKIMNRHEGDI